jgi:hypothetical protein
MTKIFFGPAQIDQTLSKLLKPIFSGNKKEFAIINNLARNWLEIMGKNYAKFCYPHSVVFKKNFNQSKPDKISNQAKLTIVVTNPAVAFFLDSNSEMITERIATLYGYKAVSKIIIKQQPKAHDFSDSFSNQKQVKLSDIQKAKLQSTSNLIADASLAEVIAKLGEEIFKQQD